MAPGLQSGDLLLCSVVAQPRPGGIALDVAPGRGRPRLRRVAGVSGQTLAVDVVPPGFVGVYQQAPGEGSDQPSIVLIPETRLRAHAVAGLRGETLRDLRASPDPRRPVAWRIALLDLWGDRRAGIDARVQGRDRNYAGAHAYEPTPWSAARKAISVVQPQPEDVFLDYGCGRGRVLAVALGFPFRRVLGVEVAEHLVREARINLASAGVRCEVVATSAATFSVPDDVTIVYAFNPFDERVWAAALARLQESIARRPRRVVLITRHVDPDLVAVLSAPILQLAAEALAIYEIPCDLSSKPTRSAGVD